MRHHAQLAAQAEQTYSGLEQLLEEADESILADEPYDGATLGAAFFGWIVAAALPILFSGLAAAVGLLIGWSAVVRNQRSLLPIFGVLLVTTVVLGIFAGGYVAGRMVRSHGGRQGFGVWLLGILAIVLFAALGYALDRQYALIDRTQAPLPGKEQVESLGGLIVLAAALLATLAAAIGGGIAGNRYHRKFDRAGW